MEMNIEHPTSNIKVEENEEDASSKVEHGRLAHVFIVAGSS